MKTVETIALGTIFPENSIGGILEVISNTPNPRLALDILLGIHEELVLNKYAVLSERTCTLVSYDKWTDNVKYVYTRNKQKYIYVPKDFDTSVITVDNYTEYGVSYGNNTKGFYVTLPETEEVTGTTDSSTWITNTKVWEV
jgi:hypothetical protein